MDLRQQKHQILSTTSLLHPLPPAQSPTPATHQSHTPQEAQTIHHLRSAGHPWSTISTHLNSTSPTTWTPARAYSVHLRSTTQIAHPTRPLGFDARDHASLRLPETRDPGLVGRKRVKSYSNAKELAGNVRRVEGGEEALEELRTVEMTAALMDAVRVVDQGFWSYVADEVERRTGRLFGAEVIRGRWFEF